MRILNKKTSALIIKDLSPRQFIAGFGQRP